MNVQQAASLTPLLNLSSKYYKNKQTENTIMIATDSRPANHNSEKR